MLLDRVVAVPFLSLLAGCLHFLVPSTLTASILVICRIFTDQTSQYSVRYFHVASRETDLPDPWMPFTTAPEIWSNSLAFSQRYQAPPTTPPTRFSRNVQSNPVPSRSITELQKPVVTTDEPSVKLKKPRRTSEIHEAA